MGKALIFCGIKHCGKSTLGKLTAQSLLIPFKDTDEMLEERWQCSVRELFKAVGEEEFRRRESALLAALPGTEQVISLGGGALLKKENEPVIRELGTVIWCDVPDEIAFERIKKGGLPPFLAEAPDPFAEFQFRNKSRRETFSRVAHVKFTPDSGAAAQKNAETLLEMLQNKGFIKR
jgi:shikimate kinase